MAKIKEVAKACGVSIATVSNIMNGKGRVSEETKIKILEVARDMNYVPNMMAKNLKQRRSKVIGIITEDLTVFNCADIIDGIHELLDERGYSFILGNLRLYKKYNNEFYHNENYNNQIQEEFRIMESAQVAGIIYVCAHCREIKFIPKLENIPIVLAYGFSRDPNIPSFIFDDEQAAYDATNELIHNGHKKIGLITGEKFSLHTIERAKGYQRALYEAGILYNPNLSYEGDWTREKGYEAAKSLLEVGTTAIFSMNDEMAAGVYDYISTVGLKAGQDVALIGFDNRELCTAFTPALTTVSIPLSEIGHRSADAMIHMLENDIAECEQINYVTCKLMRRDSIYEVKEV
ncbi:LacI family DNA-binding transcriptional regulator [Lachnoclostridium phytofermentans]|uniref:Transcriptional regulator, LacI family n=1 Tax=Lachnoclostridium phytofermentans (strain ATCC 700394 / DSM 18823 / ISDg) TaxID=357809 RepID=A9KIX8_LACP7|nr:LacI family DNA-binding transcriptional regulator [Lachnoclostridium phytofermentans]ABX40977.1 transcriptional regulator, LacI family [Lachnoclostridium phytofermentans ISDg]